MESSTCNSRLVTNQRSRPLEGIRLDNPFAFKVGQVFTGFGIGCGVGIGVGRPIKLGALPMVGELMNATRGATDAFSGITTHVNNTLRKIGARNIQAGIGCGVGFGHGFGVGLAVKPGVMQKIQACLVEAMAKMMMRFGNAPNLSSILPISLQNRMSMVNEPSTQNPLGSIAQLTTKVPDQTSQVMRGYGNMGSPSTYENSTLKSSSVDSYFGSRTQKVINSFLENPILKDDAKVNEVAGLSRSENNILQMVLKHQQIIEQLLEENEKLRRILVEDLKLPPSKLQASYSNRSISPCTDCFECRRKQRKKK